MTKNKKALIKNVQNEKFDLDNSDGRHVAKSVKMTVTNKIFIDKIFWLQALFLSIICFVFYSNTFNIVAP